jgi:hypothetical protein
MQAVLAEVYPDEGEEGLAAAANMLSPRYQASNWHEAAQQLLLEGLLSMEQALRKDDIPVDMIPGLIEPMMETWSREAQEIVVHSFDFLYFYGSDAEFYIKSIWHSWCAIPGLEDRVREYLLRTMCAISAPHLDVHPNTAFDAAKQTTEETLRSLIGEGALLGDYANAALWLLEHLKIDTVQNASLRDEYTARLLLVRFVRIFLYSEHLAARLFSDANIRGRDGYASTPLALEVDAVGNPLRFLKEHLSDNPSGAESLWVLTTLAYEHKAILPGKEASGAT